MLTLFGSKLTPIRKLLLMKMVSGGGSIVEETATGNPLTFLTDLARPLKSCLATWQPHQSGSGDPSPENVRPITGMDGVTVWHTGKNLANPADFQDGKVWWNGSRQSGYNNNSASGKISVVPGAKYTLNRNPGQQGYVSMFGKDGSFLRQEQWQYVPTTKTIPDDVYFIAFSIAKGTECQLEVGETATTYTPYTGESFPVVFPAMGKNLFDNANAPTYTRYISVITSSDATWKTSSDSCSYSLEVKPNTTYSIQTFNTNATVFRACSINVDPSTVGSAVVNSTHALEANTNRKGKITTGSDDRWLIIQINQAIGNARTGQIMVEEGTTYSDAFEPYTRTIYGGSLDLATGVLTAEYGIRQLTGYETGITWSVYANRDIYTTSVIFPGIYKDGSSPNIYGYCNVVKTFASGKIYSEWIATENSGLDGKGVTFNSVINNWGLESATAEALTEMLKEMHDNGNTLTVVYKLATPKTFQLTPQQITALLGNNTMWADSDDLSVTYLKKG